MGSAEMNLQDSLPDDILAMVAKAGGLCDLKSMRGVSKAWQRGFEQSVRSLKIHFLDPVLPPGNEAAQRFPGLTRLDLGESQTEVAWLGTLSAFPSLSCLILGSLRSKHGKYKGRGRGKGLGSLNLRLNDAALELLRGVQLERLSLAFCNGLSHTCLGCLQDMPLTSLNLQGTWRGADADVKMAVNQRLGSLTLSGDWLNPCPGPVIDAGLSHLRGLPLTSLNLGILGPTNGIVFETPGRASLEVLSRLPLTSLSLYGWSWMTDDDLSSLAGLSLTSLDLGRCDKLGADGLAHLRGLPLTSLSLEYCQVTDVSLRELLKLPLTSLDLGFCSFAPFLCFDGLRDLLHKRQTFTLNLKGSAGLDLFDDIRLTHLVEQARSFGYQIQILR